VLFLFIASYFQCHLSFLMRHFSFVGFARFSIFCLNFRYQCSRYFPMVSLGTSRGAYEPQKNCHSATRVTWDGTSCSAPSKLSNDYLLAFRDARNSEISVSQSSKFAVVYKRVFIKPGEISFCFRWDLLMSILREKGLQLNGTHKENRVKFRSVFVEICLCQFS